jgi:hypothetical protein
MEAFDMQHELYVRLRNRRGGFRGPDGHEPPGGSDYRRAVMLTMLRDGDPVFVTAEICDLIETAAATFTPESLLEQDLITPQGFLLFERPIYLDDSKQEWIDAFSWAGLMWPKTAERGYGATFAVYRSASLIPYDGSALTSPQLWPKEIFDLHFETTPNPGLKSFRLIQATFRLMLEFRPVSRHSHRPDRATMRARRRAGMPEQEIVVVTLRRERSLNQHLGGVADYSCRFMVRGHWRNQWCPSLQSHRQTWIAPYVKGPPDKPFKPPGGRAFTFSR